MEAVVLTPDQQANLIRLFNDEGLVEAIVAVCKKAERDYKVSTGVR
jgi:hypothetical protein